MLPDEISPWIVNSLDDSQVSFPFPMWARPSSAIFLLAHIGNGKPTCESSKEFTIQKDIFSNDMKSAFPTQVLLRPNPYEPSFMTLTVGTIVAVGGLSLLSN